MSEKFSLKWNDFQSNVTKRFSQLRNEEEFYDVTLVSDDQQQLSAHKVVLSTCSGYFKKVLKHNKHSHPLLCLEGINSMELNFVLDYIYQGEVQILQDQLERFLQIAQRFNLEGLNEKEIDGKEIIEENVPKKEFEEYYKLTVDDERVVEPILNSRRYQERGTSNLVAKIDSGNVTSVDDVEEKLNELLETNADGTFGCKHCGKSGAKKSRNMKNHIETHLQGLSFPCNLCGKTFRSRNYIGCHMSIFHRN